jgi:flagellar motor protein MotB
LREQALPKVNVELKLKENRARKEVLNLQPLVQAQELSNKLQEEELQAAQNRDVIRQNMLQRLQNQHARVEKAAERRKSVEQASRERAEQEYARKLAEAEQRRLEELAKKQRSAKASAQKKAYFEEAAATEEKSDTVKVIMTPPKGE